MPRVRTRVVFGILGVAGLGVLAWIATRPRPVEVDLATVTRGPLQVFVEEDGRARVRDRYVVSAPTAGTVARVELHPGDAVATGDVVARLMPVAPALLDGRTRAEAEARVAVAAAAESQARATVDRAQMALEQAKSERARNETLAAAGGAAPAAFEAIQFAERARGEELRSARFGAQVAAYQLALARTTLGRRPGGDELEVTAPLAGTVLRVAHESAGVVSPGTPLLELGDPAALEVVVDVLTSDAGRIRAGARAVLSRWGGSDLDARVRLVEPSAFTRLSSLGVEEQRVNCLLDLESPREAWQGLGDGWRVEARILVEEAPDVVTAPQSALFRDGDAYALYAVEDGVARRRTVEVGLQNGMEAEIRTGVAPGDRVIVFPGDRVGDGVEVRER